MFDSIWYHEIEIRNEEFYLVWLLSCGALSYCLNVCTIMANNILSWLHLWIALYFKFKITSWVFFAFSIFILLIHRFLFYFPLFDIQNKMVCLLWNQIDIFLNAVSIFAPLSLFAILHCNQQSFKLGLTSTHRVNL